MGTHSRPGRDNAVDSLSEKANPGLIEKKARRGFPPDAMASLSADEG